MTADTRIAEALEPCPCGGEARSKDANSIMFIVRCSDCKARTDIERCEADAISAWNKAALAARQRKESE